MFLRSVTLKTNLIFSCRSSQHLGWALKSTLQSRTFQDVKLYATEANCDLVNLKESSKKPHVPVLGLEVLNALNLKGNSFCLDMTFGAGGHSQMILESCPNTTVYALDRDPSTATYADQLLSQYPERFHYINGKFSDLPELLHSKGIGGNFFNGAIMDLGVSSMQFNSPERGFMLSQDGPLDMRMDGESSDSPSAAEILNHIDEISLYRVLKYYGEEKNARTFAKAIIEYRTFFKNIKTTKELAELIISITDIKMKKDKLQRFSHPATKTFQALRILVNDELNQLDFGIRLAHFFLQLDGVLAAVSFHSLEDSIVKRHFLGSDLEASMDLSGLGLRQSHSHLTTYSMEDLQEKFKKPWNPQTKHVVTPSPAEVKENPRARSAKLRSGAKISALPY